VADMDEEIADMDAIMEQHVNKPHTDNIFDTEEFKTEQGLLDGINVIKRCRTYDLSITYDYYHRTPRLWL